MSILFIQKRSIRAGAQTSLARLVASAPLCPLKPVVLLGSDGWLNGCLQRQGTTVVTADFPSPRAVSTRLLGLGFFARRVAEMLQKRSITTNAIVANDHQECPLALALSKSLGGIPVLGILRASAMSREDFDKYECDRCDALMGVGGEFCRRVQAWTSKKLVPYEEGFAESEFTPLRSFPVQCPRKVLVIGTESPAKGFGDFVDALRRLETRVPDFPGFECEFTSAPPPGLPESLARSTFRFMGRVDDFAGLVRLYDLAVHPSRAETFGMAPIEAMLGGTPTLVSLTGAAKNLSLPDAWIFPPGDVAALSSRLRDLWLRWPMLDLRKVQEQIRRSYHIDHTASLVVQELLKIARE